MNPITIYNYTIVHPAIAKNDFVEKCYELDSVYGPDGSVSTCYDEYGFAYGPMNGEMFAVMLLARAGNPYLRAYTMGISPGWLIDEDATNLEAEKAMIAKVKLPDGCEDYSKLLYEHELSEWIEDSNLYDLNVEVCYAQRPSTCP